MIKLVSFLSVLLLLHTAFAADYVVTTKFLDNSPGNIALSPITMGQGDVLSISFQFSVNNGRTCVLSLGENQDKMEFYVDGGRFVFRDHKNTISSTETISNNRYYQVTFELTNSDDRGSASIKFFLNGADKSSTLSTRTTVPFTNAVRKQSFIGYCPVNSAVNVGHVYFDEFKIYDRALTTTEIQDFANPDIHLPPSYIGLVVYFPFNEGTGKTATGYASSSSKESYSATLNKFASFTTRNEQGMLSCQSTGDPHVTTFNGVYWTPSHVTAASKLVGCSHRGVEDYFAILAFHDFGHSSYPKATLNRQVKVRYDNYVLKVTVTQDVFVEVDGKAPVKIPTDTASYGPFHFNWASNKLFVYGNPYGFLQINFAGGATHMDLYLKVSSTMCSVRSESYCDGSRSFISEIEYEDGGSPPLSPPLANPPYGEYDPCDESPELAEIAHERCSAKFTEGSDQYKGCVYDICATGDPDIIEDPDEECIAERRRLILEGRHEEAELLPCDDCNCIQGVCETDPVTNVKYCSCFDGYTGSDCSQEAHLFNLTLEHNNLINNRAVHLQPHFISVPPHQLANVNVDELNDEMSVEDSLFVYVGAVRDIVGTEITYKYYLFVIGDITSHKTGTPFSFSFNTAANPDIQFINPNAQNTVEGSTVTIQMDPYNLDGAVFSDLGDDWCVNFNFQGHPFRQISVGSGSKLGKLDVLKVREETSNYVKICGKKIDNPCAKYDSCDTCMADDACGWCRSSQKCLFGNAAGPTEGSSCAVWSYSFEEDISRRILAEFGVPMNPKKQDVFLVKGGSALSKLPAEITIDMGAVQGSHWDFIIISPTTVPDILEFTSKMNDYLESLRPYGDVGVSFYTYDENKATRVSVLESIDRASETLRDQIVRSASESRKDGNPTRAMRTALADFRPHSRRVVAIVVNAADSTPKDLEDTRDALMQQAVFPVFIVRQTHEATFKNFVKQLGFGHVIVIDTGAKHLETAIPGALHYASRITSMIPKELGYIVGDNEDVWNIFGLAPNMRARMFVPLERDDDQPRNLKSELVAPGYGRAIIENLLNDKPTGKNFAEDITQDQHLYEQQGNPNPLYGITIQFHGRALNPSDPVFMRIIDFGTPYTGDSVGKFYQYPDDLKSVTSYDELEEIVVGENSGFIKDPSGRVIYVPPENVFSVSNEIQEVFTTVTYVVYDACTVSDPAYVEISIIYENNRPPVASVKSPKSIENKVSLITLEGEDFREHEIKFIVSKVPYHVVDDEEVEVGRLFQFDQTAYNTLSAVNDIYRDLDLDSVLASLTPLKNNDEVTDRQGRLLFVPDRYTNSEWQPASGKYQVDPSMSFYVEQIRNQHDKPTDIMLRSSDLEFSYNIQWVNQPPSVTFFTTVPSDPDVCTFHTSPCEFAQGLGAFYPDLANDEFFPAIVTDIEEGDNLAIVITAINCSVSPWDRMDHVNGSVMRVNDHITGFTHDQWKTSFLFNPFREHYGSPYCTVSYIGFDGELYSEDEATIVTDVYRVNQPAYSLPLTVKAYADVSGEGQLYVRDPDTGVVGLYVTQCISDNDDFDFEVSIAGVSVDCDNLPQFITNITMPAELETHVPVVLSVVETTIKGHVVDVMFTLDDYESPYPLREFKFACDYSNVNRPPLVWNEPHEDLKSTHYMEIIEDPIVYRNDAEGILQLPGFRFEDPDALPGSEFTLKFTIEPQDDVYLMFSNGYELHKHYYSYQHTDYGFIVTGPKHNFTHLMDYMEIVAIGGPGPYNFSVEVHDHGNTGACSNTNPNQCNKISYATFQFTTRNGQYFGTTIAGASVAGAVVVGAAIAAFAWYRVKSLRAPTEGNDPWLLDDQQEGVVDNPMYEQRGMEGDNPIFVAADQG